MTDWKPISDATVRLECRRPSCTNAPVRNVAKLIDQAKRLYRRGERTLYA